MLTAREERFIQRASWGHRYAIILGLALSILGGGYATWGSQQLLLTRPPRLEEAFDRPVAKIGLLLAAAHQKRLKTMKPNTSTEATLIKDLDFQTNLSIRLFVVLLRSLLSGFVLTFGLILFTSGLTQREFLNIVKKLQ